jgi:ATP-dependent DNA helicase RecG
LKELDLTEGRATGIPVILTAMRNNGSSEPIFETDEDRSWFRVTLPIHPAFDPETAREFRKPAEIEQRLARLIRSLVVNDYVDDHAAIMMAKVLLSVESQSRSKSQLLEYIQLKNHNDNVKRYIEPLENNDFITKTIPNKPKSPKQEYKLTEKGRLLFQQILNYS